MNDFLNSLRNGKNENLQVLTRKPQNKANYHSKLRSHSTIDAKNNSFQSSKRPFINNFNKNQKSMDNVISSQLVDAIENLNANVETLLQNQKHQIKAQQEKADMMERQVIAIEKILDNLDVIMPK